MISTWESSECWDVKCAEATQTVNGWHTLHGETSFDSSDASFSLTVKNFGKGSNTPGNFVFGVADMTSTKAWGLYIHSGGVYGMRVFSNSQEAESDTKLPTPEFPPVRTREGFTIKIIMRSRLLMFAFEDGVEVDSGVSLPERVRPFVDSYEAGNQLHLSVEAVPLITLHVSVEASDAVICCTNMAGTEVCSLRIAVDKPTSALCTAVEEALGYRAVLSLPDGSLLERGDGLVSEALAIADGEELAVETL